MIDPASPRFLDEYAKSDPLHAAKLRAAAEVINEQRREERYAARILQGFLYGDLERTPELHRWAKRVLDARNAEDDDA